MVRKQKQPLMVFLYHALLPLLHALLLKEGIRKVLENDLPLVKDGITPEGKTLH